MFNQIWYIYIYLSLMFEIWFAGGRWLVWMFWLGESTRNESFLEISFISGAGPSNVIQQLVFLAIKTALSKSQLLRERERDETYGFLVAGNYMERFSHHSRYMPLLYTTM